jgi:hypothetical protein
MKTKETYYAVVPTDIKVEDMGVLMLAKNKTTAKKLFEVWNENKIKLNDSVMADYGLCIKKISITD